MATVSSGLRAAIRPRDAVYLTLKRAILLNELKPNAALTELGIAEDMGCSQGPVREALLRLQEDGLVLRAGHRGTTVTPLDADAAEEMLLLRREIETRAARRAAAAITDPVRQELAQIVAAMEKNAADGDAFALIENDIHFHMTLYRVAGVPALEPVLQRLMLHTHRQKLWEPRHRRPLKETAGRHHQIMLAIAQGGDALANALGAHVDTIVDVGPERVAS